MMQSNYGIMITRGGIKMTDSKEQAREKAVNKVLSVIDKAYVTIDEESYKFVVKYNADSIKHDFPFTPPAPEFEKGTFGKFWDEKPGYPIYGYLTNIVDQDYRYRRDSRGWKNFEPFYNNDPTLERAFESACEHIGDNGCDKCPKRLPSDTCTEPCYIRLRAHFLEMAKEKS